MIKKILITLGILIALVALILAVLWYLLGKMLCGDDRLVKYQSPNEKHEIVSYRRNCGATTPFVENLELNGQTILRAVTYGNKDYPFQVKWIDNQKVSVTTASSTTSMRIYTMSKDYKNIQIIFDDKIENSTKAQ